MRGILLTPLNPISADAKAKLNKLLTARDKLLKQLVEDYRKGTLKPNK